MKLIISALCIIFIGVSQSNKVVGKYQNHFGQTLQINQDSTFVSIWNFHLGESWISGKWRIKNDTIYFKIIPILDTIRSQGNMDKLILSVNQKPELIVEENFSISHLMSNYIQNQHGLDTILFYENDRLYSISRKGKLIKKKRPFMSDKKFDPWFIKKEN